MAKRKLGSFKCTKCDRTFSMPAHLARHQSAMHNALGRKKAAARREVATGGLFKAPAGLLDASPLLAQMQNYKGELLAQRSQVDSQIEAIEKAMATLGVAPFEKPVKAIGIRTRGGRTGTLKTHIENVLRKRGRPMSVKDITVGVLKAGFNTKNKALDKSVGITLAKMTNARRVTRGVFSLQ